MGKNYHLIRCSEDGLVPWSIVCIHLVEGRSRKWEPLDSSNPEVDHDWLCPECMKQHEMEQDDIENLRPVCIHCVVKLRRKFDPNFQEVAESC